MSGNCQLWTTQRRKNVNFRVEWTAFQKKQWWILSLSFSCKSISNCCLCAEYVFPEQTVCCTYKHVSYPHRSSQFSHDCLICAVPAGLLRFAVCSVQDWTALQHWILKRWQKWTLSLSLSFSFALELLSLVTAGTDCVSLESGSGVDVTETRDYFHDGFKYFREEAFLWRYKTELISYIFNECTCAGMWLVVSAQCKRWGLDADGDWLCRLNFPNHHSEVLPTFSFFPI